MPDTRHPDPFTIDVVKELQKIDAAMQQVVAAPESWDEFFSDPSRTFGKMNILPAAGDEVRDRANRIFYAALRNTELVRLAFEMFQDFPESDENTAHRRASLAEGKISNLVEFDVDALNHALSKPELLTQMYKTGIHDLNERGLLTRKYERAEIDRFAEDKVRSMQRRQAVRDQPKLESWDENYGVGTGWGVGEISLILTAQAAVGFEVAVAATWGVVVAVGVFGSPVIRLDVPNVDRALTHGDQAALRGLNMMAKTLHFMSELVLHAHYLESR
jgi:hypothetical protein